MRTDDRANDAPRNCEIRRGFTEMAPGSVLIKTGRTHVLCTASISTTVPEWRAASGKGWLTAEYEMSPGSTPSRKARTRDRLDGRTQEIQRLIGRSLRAVVDFVALGPHLITVDCDVLQADGGTRTAAITGAYVALSDAIRVGQARELWGGGVLQTQVAAISVAIGDGELLLDPDYREDVSAAVDCNLVMTGRGEWIEVQATGERTTYSDEQLSEMLAMGRGGIERLMERQRAALAD